MEAFSRARLKLVIITLSLNQSLSNYWRYNDALKSAKEKDLLEVKLLEPLTPGEEDPAEIPHRGTSDLQPGSLITGTESLDVDVEWANTKTSSR